jgi:hypothetical protein
MKPRGKFHSVERSRNGPLSPSETSHRWVKTRATAWLSLSNVVVVQPMTR